MAYVEAFSRCLIGLVFLLSAASKAPVGGGFTQFRDSLSEMRLLAPRAVRPVAALVVLGEAAVPLLLSTLPAAGFAAAAVLLLGFTAAIVTVLRRGTPAACRCFGGGRPARFRRYHVARNAVLLVVSGIGAAAVRADPPTRWPEAMVAAAAGIVVAVLVTRLDDLVELFTPLRADA
ncbi:methylamine utilization protein MauE [Virgisporangium aliadipatigenens]|uniref:Methylamine utilization protein MauE n=1 Tax=Virgisporangium aliadipatigenens TaxID=741659 RepID=A0A8J3YEQ0_9ACTN|nr:MauE/DoxX family redox-associated membrane protein [Virgisporangium aliadipatigenens]GIJ43784.1 methylamine utilization protein MauE [Virgisporangium aliadipatigenens]